ncbi:MAG: phage holin family protein [Lachnospiraceae bacterium]|nr:phage holin family protein [Lachnospiraceae bacterium]
MNYQDYIKSELIVLVPVLNTIGFILKKSRLSNRWIPAILGAISIALSFFMVISSSSPQSGSEFLGAAMVAITQGILIAGTSVYFNQLHKQLTGMETT